MENERIEIRFIKCSKCGVIGYPVCNFCYPKKNKEWLENLKMPKSEGCGKWFTKDKGKEIIDLECKKGQLCPECKSQQTYRICKEDGTSTGNINPKLAGTDTLKSKLGFEGTYHDAIGVEDVKEFIRQLKEEIALFTCDHEQLMKEIDKLSGFGE